MDPKQVIILRTKYPDGKGGVFKPRTGKLCAMAGHATLGVFTNGGRMNGNEFSFRIKTEAERLWLQTKFTKIVVYVESEEELLSLYHQALDSNIICSLIKDAANTEFFEPMYTAVAIGPDDAEKIDKITGNLKLL
jgi:PTH2 family peptidyl-tRNA hydrolase